MLGAATGVVPLVVDTDWDTHVTDVPVPIPQLLLCRENGGFLIGFILREVELGRWLLDLRRSKWCLRSLSPWVLEELVEEVLLHRVVNWVHWLHWGQVGSDVGVHLGQKVVDKIHEVIRELLGHVGDWLSLLGLSSLRSLGLGLG